MERRTVLLLSSLLFSLFAAAQSSPPVVWTERSLARIDLQSDRPGPGRKATIHAAKGESESFQIGVTAGATELTDVTIEASDFENATGRIDKSNIVLYREHYVYAGKLPYADALIPFRHPVTGELLDDGRIKRVAPYVTQPVWVDVDVPRTAATGTYTATFTASSGSGPNKKVVGTVTAELIVWNFTLPVQPFLKSAFLMGTPAPLLAKELLRHRLMPKEVPPTDEARLMDAGLNINSFPCWGKPDKVNQTMDPPPAVETLKNIAAQHERELPLYCYSADEISGLTKLHEPLKTWASHLHAAGIKQLVTTKPVSELYCDQPRCVAESRRSAVDIWVVLPKQYEESKEQCRYVQRKGDEVWSYNTLDQDDFSPKWLFESTPLEFRIQPGFINQSLGLTGLLYWRVDFWADPQRPERVWQDAKGSAAPGDGTMVYPGATIGIEGGVAPSIRLKWLRDGVDDFDYIEMLKRSGRGEWALSVARRIGPDWRDWKKSTALSLEQARIELGEALSKDTPAR